VWQGSKWRCLVRNGEASDEVDGNVLPHFLWDWQGFEDAVRGVTRGFSRSARMAVPDEALDIFPQRGPVVTSCEKFQCLRSSRVADCWGVVVVLHEPKA